MEMIKIKQAEPQFIASLKEGEKIRLKGFVQQVRSFAWGAFLIIRADDGFVQSVIDKPDLLQGVTEGSAVIIEGTARASKVNNPIIENKKVEIGIENLTILSKASEAMPFDVNKKDLNLHLDVKFDHRPIALRHPKERAIFRISALLVQGFREFLIDAGFTEIHTPKLCFAGAEGGANIFTVDYFGRKAFLAQSPQFYKQMGVGIYNRVFEVGPVFRAEKHATSRHLNEYISLDFEFGPLESWIEIMCHEMAALKYMMDKVKNEAAHELSLWSAVIPTIPDEVPILKLSEAHELIFEKFGKDYRNEPDLAPEEEELICQVISEEKGCDFVFISHFPSEKRPFYTMDDKDSPGETLSFDLLFRGVEITTGGQRINDYSMQVEKMRKFGLNPDDFSSFLQIHKHGMPPHGGLAIGLERLTAKILGISNVKEASMYPRDINRLIP